MNRFAFVRNLLLSFLVVLATASLALPQTGTTSLRGTVTDNSGGAIAGATATLSEPAQSISRTVVTSSSGAYAFLALPPGTYVLVIEMASFRRYEHKNIELLVDVPSTVNVTLEVGSTTETVEISSQLETVNTTDASLGNAFDSRQILALPFEGRDAAGVLSLQPGATFIGTNVDDNVDTRNGAINGGRSDQANITLDGVDNNDQVRGTAFQGAVRSTLDSIDEFRVTTAGDNADQGRSSGGQVALVTKSGTNTFHGSLYEQNRPTVTAANDWFNKHAQLGEGQANIPGKIIRNTFGGALGGPILKDRLFFFGTYEGQRLAEDTQVIRNVPSQNLRDGVVLYPCADVSQCPGGSVQGLIGTPYTFSAGTAAVGPADIKA